LRVIVLGAAKEVKILLPAIPVLAAVFLSLFFIFSFDFFYLFSFWLFPLISLGIIMMGRWLG